MAPFGKVHAALHSGADRVKSGILWGHHKYRQGVGLAGKANSATLANCACPSVCTSVFFSSALKCNWCKWWSLSVAFGGAKA